MFVKITRSAGRAYVKLVEAYRDESGAPRQRVVATLGRLEQVRAGGADALVRGLRRVAGEPPGPEGPCAVEDGTAQVLRFDTALSVGDTWLLTALWHRLGFADAFRRVLRNGRTSFDTERLLRVMVFNRLCDATSKLGVLRWLEIARVPAVHSASVTHQRLLRAMDIRPSGRSRSPGASSSIRSRWRAMRAPVACPTSIRSSARSSRR